MQWKAGIAKIDLVFRCSKIHKCQTIVHITVKEKEQAHQFCCYCFHSIFHSYGSEEETPNSHYEYFK